MEVSPVKGFTHDSVAPLRSAASSEPGRGQVAEVSGQERAGQSAQTLQQPESKADRASVEQAITIIQGFAQSVRRNLDFQLDDTSGRVVVKVTDSESGDIIRQIPSEEALKLAENLEEARSLLFKAEA